MGEAIVDDETAPRQSLHVNCAGAASRTALASSRAARISLLHAEATTPTSCKRRQVDLFLLRNQNGDSSTPTTTTWPCEMAATSGAATPRMKAAYPKHPLRIDPNGATSTATT